MLKRNVLRGNANAIRLARKQERKAENFQMRVACSGQSYSHTSYCLLSFSWVGGIFI